MKIFINLSVIQVGGGLQVAQSFLNELVDIYENEYYVAISPSVEEILKDISFPSNFILKTIAPSPSNIISGRKTRRLIKCLERSFHPDIVFTLFGPSYWPPKSVHLCGYALAQHIYSESPYFDTISKKNRIILHLKGRMKLFFFRQQCDFWVAETEDIASRLSEKLGVPRDRVFTVSNTYNGIFDNPQQWKPLPLSLKIRQGFKLITISSFYPHKNLSVIPVVIDHIRSIYPNFDFTFVLTIDASLFPHLTREQRKHILFLGKVKIEECPLLYKFADALFMPTLLECFTASYVEAMKMGTPILTSDLPFARDICQNAAVYFNPLRPEDMADKIVTLAHNRELMDALVENGSNRLGYFGTPKDRAERYLNILKKITSEFS